MSSFWLYKSFHSSGHWFYQVFMAFFHLFIMKPDLIYGSNNIAFRSEIHLRYFFCKSPRFSIGLMSDEFPGRFSNLISFCSKNFFTSLELWHGARSCWKVLSPDEHTFFSSVIIWVAERQYIDLSSSSQWLVQGVRCHKRRNNPKTSPSRSA